MTIDAHDCRHIAISQLETALRLYFDESDFYSVIALAGNAEEIFGKILSTQGKKNSLDELKKAVPAVYEHLFGESIDIKVVADEANHAKNVMKHCISEAAILKFDATDEAKDMLHRAIDNYLVLEQKLTPAMEKFLHK